MAERLNDDRDRTVHGLSMTGLYEVVRYDKRGKWYCERAATGEKNRCSVRDAARVAADGTAWLGRPGGRTFDRLVMEMRAQT